MVCHFDPSGTKMIQQFQMARLFCNYSITLDTFYDGITHFRSINVEIGNNRSDLTDDVAR